METPVENVSEIVTVREIKTLEELSTVECSHFPQVFAASLEAIYRYSAVDIKNTLDSKKLEVLSTTKSLLYEIWISSFPQYKEKRMIDRRAKHKLVSDIYIIGSCVQNQQCSNDLDKLFVGQSSSEIGGEGNTESACVADWIQVVGNLVEEVKVLRNLKEEVKVLRNLEEEVKVLKEKISKLESSDRCSKCNEQKEQNTPEKIPNSSNQPVSHYSIPLHNSFQGLEDQCEEVDDSRIPVEENAILRDEPNNTNAQNSQPSLVSAPKQNPQRRNTQKVDEATYQLYIGGAAGTSTEDDVKHELVGRGIPYASINVKSLGTNHPRKSFVATLPQKYADDLLNDNSWPEGIIIRPFHAKKRPKLRAASRDLSCPDEKRQEGGWVVNGDGEQIPEETWIPPPHPHHETSAPAEKRHPKPSSMAEKIQPSL